MLDDAAYPAIVEMARALKAEPRDVAAVFYLESRFDPSQYNPRGCGGRGCAGLSQLEWPELTRRGIAPATYVTWPASAQITRVIQDWYVKAAGWALKGKPARSAGVLYAVNLAPGILAQKGTAPDVVLYAAPDARYEGNKGLRRWRTGAPDAILISDLDDYIRHLTTDKDTGPTFERVGKRLDAIAPSRTRADAGEGGGKGGWLLAVALAVGLVAKARSSR